MTEKFNHGVYPVMLTPFDEDGRIDFTSLEKLIEWYIENGSAGLFAVCQSSEMFFLSQEERTDLARFIVKQVNGRIPVLASGHVSEDLEKQGEELNAIADTGVDAVILLSNRLAGEEESDSVWEKNLESLLDKLPFDLPLGFYECPYPYKRILSPELLKRCAETQRFYFIKDTCCDLNLIGQKLKVLQETPLKLFNANTSTLLESLEMGAAGFSGVMANFHPDLYVWLYENYRQEPEKARLVADFLTVASLVERQVYPVNAKYLHQINHRFLSCCSRIKSQDLLNETAKMEIDQLERMTDYIRGMIR